MEKSSALYFSFMSVIIGVLIGSFSVYFLIHIKEIKEIEKNNKITINSLSQKVENLKNLNKRLEMIQIEKKKKLKGLIDDIKKKDYSRLTKSLLLSKNITNNLDYNRLLLKPELIQNIDTETPEDDPDIKKIKEEIDKKTREIFRSTSFILKEKINKLNLQIMDKNQKLSDTNLELDKTNSILDKKNIALNENIISINKYQNKLELQNKQLKDNLNEIRQYKEKLELHKEQISSLRKIELELNKSMSALETKLEDGKLKVSFKGDILFASGSHTLKPEGKKLIDNVFPILKKNTTNNNIFIAGHTDNQKIKDTTLSKYESNWDLSTYRAIEVVKYLSKKGIKPDNITAAGFGKFRPIADNSTKAGRKKNRRVELFLIPKIIRRNNK